MWDKNSAAPSNLFTVNKESVKLGTTQSEKYHRFVAKILIATKRSRPDTRTAVSFLTTRVGEPDVDDLKKLLHLMRYIKGTISLPLILSANGGGMLK